MNRQNDTKSGILSLTVATTTLVGAEGTLAKLSATGVTPPTAAADFAPYLVIEGAAVGSNAALLPLSPDRNVRVRLNGACTKGDTLVSDATALGKVCTKGALVAPLFVVGIAEETGTDQQMVLVRPYPRFL